MKRLITTGQLLTLTAILSSADVAIATPQMGGAMGGMGGMSQSQPAINILLGPDFDADESTPFLNAYQLSTEEKFQEQGIHIDPRNVIMDTSTELPEKSAVTVQARHPKDLTGKELEQWRKEVKQKALLFGLTKVEFGESDNEKSNYAIRVGIAPSTAEHVAQLDWKKYLSAAAFLCAPDPPRIEVFNAVPIMRSNREESDGSSDDPFAEDDEESDRAEDPFASSKRDKSTPSDPFDPGEPESKVEDPFGRSASRQPDQDPFSSEKSRARDRDPFANQRSADEASRDDSEQTIGQVKASIEQLQAKLDELEQKATAVIKRHRQSDGDEQADARNELTRVLLQQFEVKQQLHALEIELMRIKLAATEALLQSRAKRREAAVRERVETLLK